MRLSKRAPIAPSPVKSPKMSAIPMASSLMAMTLAIHEAFGRTKLCRNPAHQP